MSNILKLETGEELIIQKEDEKLVRILAAKIRLKAIVKHSRRYTWYYIMFYPYRNTKKDIANLRQMISLRYVNEKMLKEFESLPELIRKTQESIKVSQ